MTAPGVGAIVGLTYASAIDDPDRFRSSKAVGAHFGLTPKRYQSGETDVTAPHLQDRRQWRAHCPLRGRQRHSDPAGERLDPEELGDGLAARAGMRKAKVALARKLAVVLRRMLADSTEFLADKATAAAG